MTLEGRAKHYKEFKCGKQRVMVATSAFGLGVDIDDICEVILFGLPEKGSELVQLAGRGGRDVTRLCLVRLVARSLDLKDCEVEVGKLASRRFCLRKVILRDILRSDELLPPKDLCCSVCKAEERPRVFVTELESTSLLPCPGASSKTSSKNRPTTRTRTSTRRVLAAQRSALRTELVKFRKTAGRSYYKTRGLDGVLSMAVIAKLVKQCNTVSSEEDVRKLGVVRDFSLAVLQLVEYHIPRTVATNVQSCGWDGTRTIPETATSDVLRDISNVP